MHTSTKNYVIRLLRHFNERDLIDIHASYEKAKRAGKNPTHIIPTLFNFIV
jgi:hypothetical protein